MANVNLTGLIVSKQVGSIYVPLFDAPYSVATDYANNDATQTFMGFAKSCAQPMLYNIKKASQFLSRLNTAIVGVAAPTLFKGGDQTGLGAGGSYSTWSPNYLGGLLGVGYIVASGAPSSFYYASDPLLVGNVAMPSAIVYPSGTFNGAIGPYSDTFVQNASRLSFASTFADGSSNPFMFTWGTGGAAISAQLDNLVQIPNVWSFVERGGYFNNVGNVVYCFHSFAGTNRLVLINMDTFQRITSSYVIQLDNTFFDQILTNFGTGLQYKVQIVQQGFLITFKTGSSPVVIGGVSRWMAQILLSADGSAWAPVYLMPQTSATAFYATSTANGNWNLLDFHIDPQGLYWAVNYLTSGASGPAAISGNFAVPLSNLLTPSFMTPNLPGFKLSCYTPCSIVSPTH